MVRFRLKGNAVSSQKSILYLVIVVFVSSLFGCAMDKEMATDSGQPVDTSPAFFENIEEDHDPFREYRIVPGDVLDVLFQIETWAERKDFVLAIDHTVMVKFVHLPELSESQKVRPDGNISLPYLGDVRVLGKKVDELRAELIERYSRILKEPDLYVVVPAFSTRIEELKKDLHTAPRGLSKLITVGPDGLAAFPLLGGLIVTGKTLPELTKLLSEMYDKMMPGLSVNLFLEKHAPLLVYVMGGVTKPGAYEIIKPTSIVEVLNLAGGPLYWARLGNVVILRKHKDRVAATVVDLKKLLEPQSVPADFSEDEFKKPLSVERLCKAINASDYGVTINIERDTMNEKYEHDTIVDELNKVLTIRDFYERVSKKKKDVSFSKDVMILADATDGYRNGHGDLSEAKESNIKTLNRLVLEETHPQETPKRIDRLSRMVYLRPEDMVYVPKRTITKVAEVMNDLKDAMMFYGWGASFGFSYDLTPRQGSGGTTVVPAE
jgi:polysaccharide export outer membrane protein